MLVEGVKSVLPKWIELFSFHVVSVHLNIFVACVPRQCCGVKLVAPTREVGSPKVQKELLGLVQEMRSWRVGNLLHLNAVDEPTNGIRLPLDNVRVPSVDWIPVEGVFLIVRFFFRDCHKREGSIFFRRNNFYINFVPFVVGPVGAVPVGEE